MLIGYARTSTVDHVAGLEAQEAALAATGCSKIVKEQASSVGQRDGLAAVLDPSTSSGEPSCGKATRWSSPGLIGLPGSRRTGRSDRDACGFEQQLRLVGPRDRQPQLQRQCAQPVYSGGRCHADL